MAEYQEVIKQYQRMCKSNRNDCKQCPLDSLRGAYYCGWWITDNPKIAEQRIMTWAIENPLKTNADKFKEIFGDEPYGITVFDDDFIKWLREEYKEPIKED